MSCAVYVEGPQIGMILLTYLKMLTCRSIDITSNKFERQKY